jgi:hypothetical protein
MDPLTELLQRLPRLSSPLEKIELATMALSIEPQIEFWSLTQSRDEIKGFLHSIIGSALRETAGNFDSIRLEQAISHLNQASALLAQNKNLIWAVTKRELGLAHVTLKDGDFGQI